MRLGSGRFQYELVEGWGKPPMGKAYGYTHGVIADSRDRVYIHNTSKDAVMIFDPEGNFQTSWGKEFEGTAHGMFYNKEGQGEFLYFSDPTRHLIAKYSIDGKNKVWERGLPEGKGMYENAEQYKPTDLAVAPNGDFYVGDGYGLSWIHHYDKDAKYLGSFGGPAGSEPGKVNSPHGIWVDTRRGAPELYVADRANNRVQVFTMDGKHKRFLTDEMRLPCCFFQHKDYQVVPHLRARVTILDQDDKTAAILGDNPALPDTKGWPEVQDKLETGKFSSPHAACVDSKEDMYVVEWISTGRVTKLKRVK